jgi:hypothetical protein
MNAQISCEGWMLFSWFDGSKFDLAAEPEPAPGHAKLFLTKEDAEAYARNLPGGNHVALQVEIRTCRPQI